MLIRNVEELRKYLGRAVNASFEIESLQPFIELAEDEYLKKGLGLVYFNELNNQVNGTGSVQLSANNAFILPYIQRALAFYTYHLYLPYAIGNDGDNGLQETETDTTKPARIGVLEKRQRATIENASKAMETVLELLFAEPNKYPTFWGSAFGIAFKKSWFGTAEQLSNALPLVDCSYRLLLTLNKYFVWAETARLQQIVGIEIMTMLKNYHLTPNLVTGMADLYRLSRQYLAWAAYEEALLFLNVVQLGNGGLRVLSEFDGINNTKAPDQNTWMEYKRNIDTRTSSARADLIGFLNKNADNFPTFKTSILYKAESQSRLPDNKKYRSVFRMK
ncbi:DUF6712 family protein [Arcicella aquatica]|uniref:DUF6712 family protein n=1 Tax=Arcicella aquatica TaxID=217141 RepID=A0ABU5QJC7_9BACT|nr:DUF6712 family protein [Arcicella aquatica]MEA5257172.1 DUF6712 family protein [Arcicella aquatica]